MKKVLIVLLSLLIATPAFAGERIGWGDSRKDPEGDTWVLPAGIEMPETIKGYHPWFPESCKDPEGGEDPPADVTPTLVQACFIFRNTHDPKVNPGAIIKIVIPPGLTVIADSKRTQNGIVIQRKTVVVEPGQTLYVPMHMMCMNVSRSGSGLSDTFKIGPITKEPAFLKLASDLENRELGGPEDQAMVQTLVYDIADKGKIGDFWGEKYGPWLASLPLKKPEML